MSGASTSMRSLYAAADRALAAISDELDKRFARAVERVGKRNPNERVTGASAMGTWVMYVGDREIDDPVFRTFERALDRFGWGAIPAPVAYEFERGVLTRRTEW